MTLNHLENLKIRAPYKDPRIHFALVCAATSCPVLTNAAYLPASLDSQLEEQTRKALNNPTFIRTSGNQVQISKIFDWYKADFGSDSERIAWIDTYREDPIKGKSVTFYDYDWRLNKK